MLVALVGVLALSAVTAVAAQAAAEAPRWSIGGKPLGEGETHFFTAKAYSAHFALVSAGATITCESLRLLEGSLLGSAVGNAGKDNEIIEFFGKCTVTGTGITNCTVTEPIVTNPVRSELVETEKAEPANKKGSLLVLFEPAPGSNGFVTIKFKVGTGGKCPAGNAITVSGSVAGQVLTDPENGKLGELVELGQAAKEAKSWLLNFPTTAIRKVTKINKGEPSEAKVGLLSATEEAVLEGTALVLLAKRNAKGELESEATLWSPLP
jgi:hypothetical protein